jgi:hypothetical protein
VPDIIPAIRHSLHLAREIRAVSSVSPGKLLGFLYVVQGTTKGNQVHLPDIVRCFNLNSDEGASFYRGYGTATEAHWEEFRSVMNGADEELAHDALQGTVDMYDALQRFHESLYPLSEANSGFTASALNPEAGDHSVPQDKAILQAALRAGRRCRNEFSYYERRYGERGLRFTDSDAAWLAALADQPVSVVADQVLWLSRVLSSRGMPFLLMERQLELLIEELTALENGFPTESLQEVISNLRHQRYLIVSQARFDELCSLLSQQISPQMDFSDLPIILAAAHIDACSGMPECMSSLVSWLGEGAILTKIHIEAVQRVLLTARLGTPACREGNHSRE